MNLRKPWTNKDDAQLEKLYPDHTAREISAINGRSIRSIYRRAGILGLHKSIEFYKGPKSGRLDGTQGKGKRFVKKQTPWNKGKKGWKAGGRSHETQFKSGYLGGQAALNKKDIGATRLSREGYLQIKINNDLPFYKRWESYHRLLWEKHYGKIPAKHVIRFKDGMKTSIKEEITLDKLECISRADNAMRNSIHRYPKEIKRLMQLRGAINRQINKRTKKNEHNG